MKAIKLGASVFFEEISENGFQHVHQLNVRHFKGG